jgi:hypothetical protein
LHAADREAGGVRELTSAKARLGSFDDRAITYFRRALELSTGERVLSHRSSDQLSSVVDLVGSHREGASRDVPATRGTV